jgi:hypothetical protein
LTENTLIPANPGPWVDPERREAQPWLTHDGIVKFFEFPVRIPTMSHRAFHLYWQRHHSPNVMNVTGFAQFMRKYNSGHRFPRPRKICQRIIARTLISKAPRRFGSIPGAKLAIGSGIPSTSN